MIFEVDVRVIEALWFILPAYIANSFPINVSKMGCMKRFRKPIDGGRKIMGKRVFGDGKTWRGLFAGVCAGTFIGFLQQTFQPECLLFLQSLIKKSIPLEHMSVELAFLLSLGALLGDMGASFIKRQSGLKRGDPAPVLDQLDFILGAVFLSWLLIRSINYERFYVLVVITPVIHVIGNIGAWMLKLKKKPW